MKTVTVAALAAIVALSSCTKGGEVIIDDNGAPSSMKVQVLYPQSPASRGVGNKLKPNEASTLKPGHLLFVNKSGVVVKDVGIVDVLSSAPADRVGSVEVTIKDITEPGAGKGAVIDNVPASAVKVHIISNYKNSSGKTFNANLENVKIDDILTEAVSIVTINSNDFPLYGAGGITDASGSEDGKSYTKQAALEVKAQVSRLQIGKISVADSGPIRIRNFTVEGIFINRVHMDMELNGTGRTPFKLDSSTKPDDFFAQGDFGAYIGDAKYVNRSSASAEVLPGTKGEVWYFNLFPTAVPHIIIKLSDAEYIDIDNNTQRMQSAQFITLGNFKFADGSEVKEFLPNNIYHIDNIVFDYNDLTDKAEQMISNTLVRVTMMPWTANDIVWNKQ